nr:MAG TPA: hypothetical protein [Caudoviricetes sp.]
MLKTINLHIHLGRLIKKCLSGKLRQRDLKHNAPTMIQQLFNGWLSGINPHTAQNKHKKLVGNYLKNIIHHQYLEE